MAKNRNQDRDRQRPGRTEKPRKDMTESAPQPQASPAEVARKHQQRRFGHN